MSESSLDLDSSQAVRFEGVSKSYGQEALAVDHLDLEVASGEFLTILGPSGSGKSTTLRLLAGLEELDSGRIFVGGQDVTSKPTHLRNLGMVAQNYALFPHMTVFENVAFGLRVGGAGKKLHETVSNALDLVDMGQFAQRLPKQLSGGQQQRVALVRALVTEPHVLLLDEPFGALDRALRTRLQIEFRQLQQSSGITTLLVTHDQEEALLMSDKVAVMKQGALQQVGDPKSVYEKPSSPFVASFLGGMNFLSCSVENVQGEQVSLAHLDQHFSVRLDEAQVVMPSSFKRMSTQRVRMGVRPEDVKMATPSGPHRDQLLGRVVLHHFLGDRIKCVVEISPSTKWELIISKADYDSAEQPGSQVGLTWEDSSVILTDEGQE